MDTTRARFFFFILKSSCLIVLTACSAQVTQFSDAELQKPRLPSINTNLFGSSPDFPSPEELHQLTPEQEADFLGFYHAPRNEHMRGYIRIFEYIDDLTPDFKYLNTTYQAQDTLRLKSGNCMSLAMLTSALAGLANVRISYQLMDDDPVYQFGNNLVQKGVHIRTYLYQFHEAGDVTRRSGIKMDFFPSGKERFIGNITSDEYLASYYRNIAADSIVADDLSKAYWYSRESLKYAPLNAAALSNIAIAFRRAGDSSKAEQVYKFGIAHADGKELMLKNYSSLLDLTGRESEADDIRQLLSSLEAPNPFYWYRLAQSATEDEDHSLAIQYLRKALDMAPYAHQLLLDLALAYYEIGDHFNSLHYMQLAEENALDQESRSLYQAKLKALRGES